MMNETSLHENIQQGPVPLFIMRLIVGNFDKQQIVTREQVVMAIRRLPQSHYAGIRAIRYDPYRTLATHFSFINQKPSTLRTKGLYYHEHNLSVIIVFQFTSISQFHHILYHEIGHYVFLQVLNQEHRNRWFYSIRPSEDKYVSSQARQNSREDFAETYAFYCTEPSRLNLIPHKATFIRDRVFTGEKLQPLS